MVTVMEAGTLDRFFRILNSVPHLRTFLNFVQHCLSHFNDHQPRSSSLVDISRPSNTSPRSYEQSAIARTFGYMSRLLKLTGRSNGPTLGNLCMNKIIVKEDENLNA